MRYSKIIKEDNLEQLEGKINSLLNSDFNLQTNILGISTNVYNKDGVEHYIATILFEHDHSKK